MTNAQTVIQTAVDTASDLLDKASTTTTRSGLVANRVASMLHAGVAPAVVAAQLSAGSANGQTYTPEHVQGIAMVHQDAKTKVPVTAKQARALTADQQQHGSTPNAASQAT